MTNIVLFQSRPRSFRSGRVTLFQSQSREGSSFVQHFPTREQIAGEMQEIVRMAGEDGGTVIKAQIALASRRLGLPFVKTRKLWYREQCTIAAHEADMLRSSRSRILAERARRLQGQLDVVHARMRALEGGRDEAVARGALATSAKRRQSHSSPARRRRPAICSAPSWS